MGNKVQTLAGKSIATRNKAGRRELRELVEAQEYRCNLSGIDLTPEVAELDHKIPVFNGGEHNIENLQVLHATINRMKGTMDNEEFIRLCKLVAKWNG